MKYVTVDYVYDITGETINSNLLNAAESIVEKHANCVWEATTVTNEVHSGNGSAWLQTLNYPIISFTSATIYDDDGNLETSISSSDITESRKHLGRLKYDDGWDEGNDNIKISYTWGYTTIPENVKIAIAHIAAYLKINPIAAKSESIVGVSITHGTIDDILRIVPRRDLI